MAETIEEIFTGLEDRYKPGSVDRETPRNVVRSPEAGQ